MVRLHDSRSESLSGVDGARNEPMDSLSAPLTSLSRGERAVIVSVDHLGPLARLAALGFTPGAEVCMVRNSGRGPVIVSLLDTQVALGRGPAMRIIVRKEG